MLYGARHGFEIGHHELDLSQAQGATASGSAGETIVIPDAHLLFNAEFKKLGPDLVLIGEDGRKFVVHDYFAGERRATLATKDGASLTPGVVEALAGPDNPGQYAQAAAVAATAQPIGRVEKASGIATVVRNGVSITLNVGDPVLKGDVVQTGRDSALGISFIDGTAFSLSSSARMVLNEMVYDPNSTTNVALLSLVEGTIGFVAGKVAKTGDMRVDTPVATMGIRGTIGLFQGTSENGQVSVKLSAQPHDDGTPSIIDVIDRSGRVVGTLRSGDTGFQFTQAGVNAEIKFAEFKLTPLDLQNAATMKIDLAAVAASNPVSFNNHNDTKGNENNPNSPNNAPSPQSGGGGGGSSSSADVTTLVGNAAAIGNPVVLAGSDASQVIVPNAAQQSTTVTLSTPAATTGGQTGETQSSSPPSQGANPPSQDASPPSQSASPGLQATGPILVEVREGGPAKSVSALGHLQSSSAATANVGTTTLPAGVVYDPVSQTFTIDPAKSVYKFLAEGQQGTFTVQYTVSDAANDTPVVQTLEIHIAGVNDAAQLSQPLFFTQKANPAVFDGVATVQLIGGYAFSDVDLSDSHTLSVAGNVNNSGNLTFILSGDGAAGQVTWQYNVDLGKVLALGAGQPPLTDKFVLTLDDGHTGGAVARFVEVATAHVVEAGGTIGSGGIASLAGIPVVTGNLAELYEVVTNVATDYGHLSIDAAGHWTYTLDNLNSTVQALKADSVPLIDTIQLTYADGDQEEIAVVISGANDAATIAVDPSATNDRMVVEAGGVGNAITGDPSASGKLLVSDPDSGEAHFAAVSALSKVGAYGSFTFDEQTGAWTYLLDQDKADKLAAGEHATDSLTVTSADGTASHTIAVDIAGSNDAPVITSADSHGVVAAGHSNLVANGGFESGDFTSWTLSGALDHTFVSTSGAHTGTFGGRFGAIPSDTFLSQNIQTVAGQHYLLDFWLANDGGTPNDFSALWNGMTLTSVVNGSSQGFTEYTFDVVGAAGASALQFVFKQVPAYWSFDDISVVESQGSTQGTISFADVDHGDMHTASFAPENGGAGYVGVFSLDPNVTEAGGSGSIGWHFTVDDSQIAFLSSGQTLTQYYDVMINDGHSGGSVTQVVTVTINGSNHGPDAVDDSATVNEGASATIAVLANDTDGASLGASNITAFTQGAHGSVVRNSDGTFTYTHDGSETTSDSFTYTLTDAGGLTDTATVSLTINPVNDEPALGGDRSITVAEGGTYTLIRDDLAAFDPDNSDGQLTYTVSPQHGSFTVGSAIVTSFTQQQVDAGQVVYHHDGSETTSDNFTIGLSDGAASTSGSFTIAVTPVNDPPALGGDRAITVNEGGTYTLTRADLAALDPDNTDGQLTYTIAAQHGYFTVGSATEMSFTQQDIDQGLVVYHHDGSETTSDNFTIGLSDGAASTSGSFTIAVTPVNDRPVITGGDQTASVQEDGGASLQEATGHFTAADPDSPNLTWDVVNANSASPGTHPSHPADYLFKLDSLKITNASNGTGGAVLFFDDFSGSGPTIAGSFGSAPYSDQASSQTALPRQGGDLILDDEHGTSNTGIGTPDPFTSTSTTLQSSRNAGNSQGLKKSADFTVEGRFDLVAPDDLREAYGIRLTDRVSGVGGDDTIELLVRKGADGLLQVQLRDADFVSDTVTRLGSFTLDPAIFSPGDQIALRLMHTANQGVVTAAFDIIHTDPSTLQVTTTSHMVLNSLGQPAVGHLFGSDTTSTSDDEVWTRPQIIAFAPTQADSYQEGTYGTLSINQAGDWDYVLANNSSAVQALSATDHPHDVFTIQVADGQGGLAQRIVDITVDGTNDAPRVSAPVSASGQEGGAAFSVNLLQNASDIDHGAVLHIRNLVWSDTGSTISLPAGFALSGGTLSVDPSNAAYNGLAAGQPFASHFTYDVVDEFGALTHQTATITINGANDAPVIDAHASSLAYEEGSAPTAVAPNLTVADVDSPRLDHATVAITQNYEQGEDLLTVGDAHGLTTVWDAATGTLTLSGSGTLATYQAALQTVGFFYGSGAVGGSEDREITFSVTDTEGAPSNAAVVGVTVTHTSNSTLTESGLDAQGEPASGDAVTNTTLHLPTGYAVDTSANSGWAPLTSVAGEDGHSYVYIPVALTWSEAQALAASLGGYLATITSAAENAHVVDAIGDHNAFIGATDAANEGHWLWAGGAETNQEFWFGDYTLDGNGDPQLGGPGSVNGGYAHWDTSPLPGILAPEPNNLTGHENGAEIRPSGFWNDVDDGSDVREGFVIEFDPAHPASALYQEASTQGYGSGILSVGMGAKVSYVLNNNAAVTDGLGPTDTPTDAVLVSATNGAASLSLDQHYTVQGQNDAPLAADDVGSIDSGSATFIQGNILANDTDAENDPLTVTSIVHDAVGPRTIEVDGIYGHLSVEEATGDYTYTLGQTDDQVAALSGLGSGNSAVEDFTYAISDGHPGGTAEAHLGITVTGSGSPAQPPVGAADSYAVDEDNTLTVQAPGVLGNDSSNGGSYLYAYVNQGDQPTHGALSFNSDGSFEYVPDPNYNGSDSFTYYAYNDGGGSDPTTVHLTINPVNDAPEAPAGAFVVEPGTVLSGNLGATDVDGDTLAYTIGAGHGPAHGTLGPIGADGAFAYTPAAGYAGDDAFIYTVSDGQAAVDATVTIHVDHAPTFTNATQLELGSSTLVSAISSGAHPGEHSTTGYSYWPSLWAAENKIAFQSFASDLTSATPPTPYSTYNIFVKDLGDGSLSQVTNGNGSSLGPSYSSDGKLVFWSYASDLVVGDTNASSDVFLQDANGIITAITPVHSAVAENGTEYDNSYGAFISADGHKVAFVSYSDDLPGKTLGDHTPALYVKDLTTDTFALIATNVGASSENRPQFSPDGSKLLFMTTEALDPAHDTNNTWDIYAADLGTGHFTLVSSRPDGSAAFDPNNQFSVSKSGVFSPDGGEVAFVSTATNLVTGDTNSQADIFIKHLDTGAVERLSADSDGHQLFGGSADPVFSSDGRFVAFEMTGAPQLGGGDLNLFVKDLLTGTLTKLNETSTPGFSEGQSSVAFDLDHGQIVFAAPHDKEAPDYNSPGFDVSSRPAALVSAATGSVQDDPSQSTLTTQSVLTFSDADASDHHSVSVSDVGTANLGHLTATISKDTTNGGGQPGLIKWVYTTDESVVRPLNSGETHTDHFNITLQDDAGKQSAQQVDIAVHGLDEGFLGNAAALNSRFDQTTNSHNVTVGNGPEFTQHDSGTNQRPVYSVDLENNKIIFDFDQHQSYTGSTPSNGFWGWDVAVPNSPPISAITLNPASDAFDTQARLTNDDHAAHFNFNGLTFDEHTRLIFDVTFQQGMIGA